MVRYYGWYSNPPAERAGKSRGIRNKQGIERSSHEPVAEPDEDIEIIDVKDLISFFGGLMVDVYYLTG